MNTELKLLLFLLISSVIHAETLVSSLAQVQTDEENKMGRRERERERVKGASFRTHVSK